MSEVIEGKWSDESAFDLELAKLEGQRWVEAVTGEMFPHPDFTESLKDGRLLCKLINCIVPGSVAKVNPPTSAHAQMENLAFFLHSCRVNVGLKNSQLFEGSGFFQGKRVRDVAIALYWLGRACRANPDWHGPQMDITKFMKLKCTRCQKPIEPETQDYILTRDQQWHLECAKCDKCNKCLDENEGYYMDGNKLFCPPCYLPQAAGGESCAQCKNPLRGKYVEGPSGEKVCEQCCCANCHSPLLANEPVKFINGRKFCPRCVCAECSDPLRDNFVSENGKNFCPRCVAYRPKAVIPERPDMTNISGRTVLKPKAVVPDGLDRTNLHEVCCACNEPLGDEVTEAEGKLWHTDCFNCHRCRTPLTETYAPYKGVPYCTPCYHKVVDTPNCRECQTPLEGKCVCLNNSDQNAYHPPCFKCWNCKKNLPTDGSGVIVRHGEPYCGRCFGDQFPGESAVYQNPGMTASITPGKPYTTTETTTSVRTETVRHPGPGKPGDSSSYSQGNNTGVGGTAGGPGSSSSYNGGKSNLAVGGNAGAPGGSSVHAPGSGNMSIGENGPNGAFDSVNKVPVGPNPGKDRKVPELQHATTIHRTPTQGYSPPLSDEQRAAMGLPPRKSVKAQAIPRTQTQGFFGGNPNSNLKRAMTATLKCSICGVKITRDDDECPGCGAALE